MNADKPRAARPSDADLINQFGPMPTMRQQVATLVIVGSVMAAICGTLSYLGLI